MRVYLDGTGGGDAVTAFAQLSRDAAARGFQVTVEDPEALANGFGRFSIDAKHTHTREDAVAVVRALLDQLPDATAAFTVSPAQE